MDIAKSTAATVDQITTIRDMFAERDIPNGTAFADEFEKLVAADALTAAFAVTLAESLVRFAPVDSTVLAVV